MKITIDGKEYNWKLPKLNLGRSHSKFHLQVRDILREVFPFDAIFEEVKIPKLRLFVDFLIPSRNIALECNGRQHYEYVPHFHPSLLDFLHAQKRDRQKIEVLEQNGFTVISLKYDEPHLWKMQIQQNKH